MANGSSPRALANETRADAGGETIWQAAAAQTVRLGFARYSGTLRKCPSSLAIDALACGMLRALLGHAMPAGAVFGPVPGARSRLPTREEEAMQRVIGVAASAGLLVVLLLPWAVILAWLYSRSAMKWAGTLTTSW